VNWAEIIDATSSIAVAFAAVTAAWAAIRGLGTWREQLVWQSDRDLANRVLSAVYSYRNALFEFRRPKLSSEEDELYGEQKDNKTYDFDEQMQKMEPILSQRIKFVAQKSADLSIVLEEVRFTWGSDLPEAFSSIFSLEVEISNFLGSYYRSLPNMDEKLRKTIHEALMSYRGVISEAYDDEETRRIELSNRVKEIESFLQKKLGRKQ
jgi:hypothetical protein